jgi:biopolymer transport protein ExbD
MKFARNAKVFRGQIDFAPIASVLFLLVIFLLLNSGLVFTPGVKIDLPLATPEPLPGTDRPTVVVAIAPGGQFYFDHQVIAPDVLRSRLVALAQARTNLTLVVQADKSVRYDVVVRLSQMARETGIHEILLALRPESLPVSTGNSR